MLYRAKIVVFFSDKYETHKYIVGRAYSCWMLNLLVHHITSRLLKVSNTLHFLIPCNSRINDCFLSSINRPVLVLDGLCLLIVRAHPSPLVHWIIECTLYIQNTIFVSRLRWPCRSRRIFGEKILSTPSFGGEVKPSVPCRRFAAC
jgi:hypothetical protein